LKLIRFRSKSLMRHSLMGLI